MNYLTANLWSGDVDSPTFIEPLRAISNIRLLWEIPGGVHAVELDYAGTSEQAYEFYERYVGDRVVVSDNYCDKPVAEGWVYGVAISPKGNSILCRGPWYRHFDRYDMHSAKMTDTTTEILKDSLTDYVAAISDNYLNVEDTGFQLDPSPGLGPELVENGGMEASGSGSNMVANGTFETLDAGSSTFESWAETIGTSGSIDDENSNVNNGNHAVKLTDGSDDGRDTYLTQTVSVINMRRYKLSLHARGSGGYFGAYLVTDVTNGNDIISETVANSDEREIVDVEVADDTFAIPGDESANISVDDTFTVSGSTGNDGTYTVAAVTYNSESDETDIDVDEDITDSTEDGTITLQGLGYKEFTESFTAPDGCETIKIYLLSPSTSGEVCYFDDVEVLTRDTTIAYWYEHESDGAIAAEEANQHSGGQAVKLVAGSGVDTHVVQPIYVVEGEEVKLSMYARGDGTYAGQYKIVDASNSNDIVSLKSTGVSDASYSEVTETFTIPSDCSYVEVYLYCPSTDTGTAYFDDVSLKNTTVYWQLSDRGIYPGDLIKKLSVMSDSDLRQWNYWVQSAPFASGLTPQKPVAYFKPQKDDGTFDWQIWRRDLARGSLTMERNIEDLANKVLVIYRDISSNEQRVTEWSADSDSQSEFWIREVIKSGGQMVPDAARQYQKLYRDKFSGAMLRRSFTLSAPMITAYNWSRHPLWRVIASGGGYVRFNDLYPSSELIGQSWDRKRVGQIMTAEYDDSQGTLRIVLDTSDERLDRLLARLGAY